MLGFSDVLDGKAKALAEELGQSARFQYANATSPEDTEKLMDTAMKHFDRREFIFLADP